MESEDSRGGQKGEKRKVDRGGDKKGNPRNDPKRSQSPEKVDQQMGMNQKYEVSPNNPP